MADESKAAASGDEPVRVCLTGAAGNIAYALAFMISQGRMFGDKKVDLRLLDIPQCKSRLTACGMELQDCASPLLASVTCTTDYEEAFTGVQYALLVGARPRGKGMERSDLLVANAAIFEGQGKALDKYADRSVKVLVVGNPANTNAVITMTNAPSIPKKNFAALTRLDQNRGTALLAHISGAPVSTIGPMIVWGNHSSTQFPDARFATVEGVGEGAGEAASIATALVKCGRFGSIAEAQAWLAGEFVTTIQRRGAAVIEQRGASSAGSAANAICDCVRDWFFGTNGRIVSMGVVTDGVWYDLPKGLVFSLPVTIDTTGEYHVVTDLAITKAHPRIATTTAELLKEREIALGSSRIVSCVHMTDTHTHMFVYRV